MAADPLAVALAAAASWVVQWPLAVVASLAGLAVVASLPAAIVHTLAGLAYQVASWVAARRPLMRSEGHRAPNGVHHDVFYGKPSQCRR